MEPQVTPDVPTMPIVVLVTISSLEERRAKCAWCWERLNPGIPYPEEWSSTICPACDAEIEAQITQEKAARAARRARGER